MSPRLSPSFRRAVSFIALRTLAGALAAAGAGAAHAQDFLIGIAAGSDRGRVDCVASFPCDRSSSRWKLTGAWRFADPWDLQLAYFSGGRFHGGDPIPAAAEFGGTFRVEGIGLTAGYRWPFAPSWSAVGRLGAASMRTRFEYANALAGDVSKTTLQPLAGVGIDYAITPSVRIGIDYDVTRFKVYRTQGSLRMLGLAAQFSF
ncbi:MAG: outer membrane beta-barrel protein [Caldimonas sp.]